MKYSYNRLMIGELFNKMVDEIAGDDPATRRSAALPYLFAKHAGYAEGFNATMSAMTAAPALAPAAPPPSAFRM